VNDSFVRRSLTLVLLLLFALPMTALAATPTAQFWEEIGGSASGAGISASELGVVPEHRNTSILVGSDGRPVVAYTDWADIVVRRWNGAEWEIIARPGGGHLPQLAMDGSGRIYLAWMGFVPETQSWEVFLLVRDAAGGDWQELGGSAAGGGISGADGRANVNSFSLALGPDGTPWVAYDTKATAGADFTTVTSGIARDSEQVYVKRWTGPTGGWVYVGSDRTGGGASKATSFVFSNDDGSANFARHGALSPTLAIRGDGSPVLAFIYFSEFQSSNPPQYNGLNDDIYAVTWNGSAWVPMGPPVPATAAGAGLGGPGGISNDTNWANEDYVNRMNRPYVIIARDGAPVLGWGSTDGIDGFRHMYVRRWSGSAWQGLGSATGEIAMSAFAYDISLAPGLNGPVAAWAGGGGADASIYVLGWDARVGRWTEVGTGSATGTGISGPTRRGFTPWITLDAAGLPSVTWIEAPDMESGGQTFVRTFEPRSLADLTLTALTAPATARTGGTISVANTVRNLGVVASPSVPLNFYLATATTRGASDVLLGSRTIPALGVNGTSSATNAFAVSPSVEPGTYYVLAALDEAGAVTERNESNNVRASAAMTITLFRPELTLTSVGVPAAAAAGRPLTITSTVRNSGPAPAGSFVVQFYLSTDGTLDGGNVLLGARTIPSLGAGAMSTAATMVTLPADTPVPATYRVVGLVDALEQQAELEETNNATMSGTMSVTAYQPDLTITALTAPPTGAVGRPMMITDSVRNGGPAPSGAFTVRYYLSSDETLHDTDVLLGARTIMSLAPGASSTVMTTLMVPANTSAPATYHVIAVADAASQQTELAENNNRRASAGVAVSFFRPDLTVSVLTVPAAGAVGRPLAITNIVRNQGPAPAGAFTVRFYLSSDGTLHDSDTPLGMRVIGGLAAGAASSVVSTFTIPLTTTPGDYQVIAVADALGQQTETDESNNRQVSATFPISLYRPDLMLTALSVPATAVAGRPLAITHTVRNRGAAPAGAFTVRFYLSADGALDDGDVLLGARMMGGLAAGASSPAVTSLTIPANTSVPGSYQVIAVVDAMNQQTETDETNNMMMTSPPMSVVPYLPDFWVSSVTAQAGAAAGRPLTITHTIRNLGAAPAGVFTVRYYLSADDKLDDGDVLLGSRTFGGMAGGATRVNDVTTVTVPAGTVVPNPYRVLVVVDALGQQAELDETNNVTASGPLAASSPSPNSSAR